MFMHTTRDNSLLGTMRFISRHEDNQVYGVLLPKAMTNQAMLNSDSYKIYYAIATGVEPLKTKKTQKKYDSAISFEETPSKKKPTKAKIDVPSTKIPVTKPKLIKKKASVKTDRGKSDGIDFQLGVLDEQQCKISGTYEGTGVKLGVPDVPKYDFASDKESWGDSGEDNNDDDDADDTKDDEGNNDGDDSDGNDDDDDNDVQQKDDGIFITQDKYVAEILKKFDFATMKIASTPMEPNKALVKDEEDDSVEIHLYRSMIGSLMYLTASRPDITFAIYTCARFQVTPKTSHLHAVKRALDT
ncbi:hypothetical protein Tco_0899755 [Tanacetum coccineum]